MEAVLSCAVSDKDLFLLYLLSLKANLCHVFTPWLAYYKPHLTFPALLTQVRFIYTLLKSYYSMVNLTLLFLLWKNSYLTYIKIKTVQLGHHSSSAVRAHMPCSEAASLLQRPRVWVWPTAICFMSSTLSITPFPVNDKSCPIIKPWTAKNDKKKLWNSFW